ncbi:MAG: acyl-CoA carboxylase subunit epsilon [Dermatophilaceae bacterium]
MTDNTSRGSQGTQWQEATDMPVRLIRGEASPEELAALVTVLTAARDAGAPDPTDRHSPASRRSPHSHWSSPSQMTRTTHPHGPGGWRASARPR